MLIDFIVGYKLSKRKKRKYRSLNNLLPSIRLDGNLWPFCHSRRRLRLFLLQDCFRRAGFLLISVSLFLQHIFLEFSTNGFLPKSPSCIFPFNFRILFVIFPFLLFLPALFAAGLLPQSRHPASLSLISVSLFQHQLRVFSLKRKQFFSMPLQSPCPEYLEG